MEDEKYSISLISPPPSSSYILFLIAVYSHPPLCLWADLVPDLAPDLAPAVIGQLVVEFMRCHSVFRRYLV